MLGFGVLEAPSPMATTSAIESADRSQAHFAVAKKTRCLRNSAWAVCIFVLAAAGNAAAMQVPSTPAVNRPGISSGPTAHRVARRRTKPPSPDQSEKLNTSLTPAATPAAPKAAVVTLQDGFLTVKADDSDLREVLNNIAALGGMSINGQIGDSRVYGSYGPGAPNVVISNLLEGSGYNVLMAGVNPLGMPRQLILTPKTGGPSAPSGPAVAIQPSQSEGPEVDTSDGEPLGPGAIANAPPEPSDDQATRMKQQLQRLQQIQDQLKEPQEPK